MQAIFPLSPEQLVAIGAVCERLNVSHSGVYALPVDIETPEGTLSIGVAGTRNNGQLCILPSAKEANRYIMEFRNADDCLLVKLAFDGGAA